MISTFVKCQIIFTLICHAFCYVPTEEDLECFNDFETEMKCSLSTENLKNCSGYQLNITHKNCSGYQLNITHTSSLFEKMYTCVFERSYLSDNCECKIKVEGFVFTEIFKTTLLQGTNILLRKIFTTEDFIKPKTPVLLVQNIENGNFNVTWNNRYEKNDLEVFLDDLFIHLTYGIKGGLKNISETMQSTVGSFKIVGKNLQPNTNYIVTATVSTAYNNHRIFSDQSTPVEFTTLSSPNERAKIIILLLCLSLSLIIFTIFFCILRMKTNWWDKISKPKIDANLGEEKGHILPPSDMKFSSIHVEISTLDFQEDKKLISALSIDANDEKSFHSVGSVPVDYGQARSGSSEENISPINNTAHVLQALDGLFKFKSVTDNPSPSSPYNQVITSRTDSVNGISSSRECNRSNRDSGNCSGSSAFSNVSYCGSAMDDSSFLLSSNHACQSSKREVSDSDAGDSQFNSPTNDTLGDGYQCFSSVLGKGDDADVFVERSDDVGADEKCIMTNLITSPNPLYPLILQDSSDEGYQAFQGLTKSTVGQWSTSISTEQALNACGALKFPPSTGQDPTSVQQSSWATSLHFPPVIQMDSSYQCV